MLLDRDGTLIVDVPYNANPKLVRPMLTARAALRMLRRAGVPTAVVSNQSGIGRGLLTAADADAVNARMVQLLGPLGPIHYCPHTPTDGCACRKPAPGLLLAAAAELGVPIGDCVVVGDIGPDVAAARAAGARAVLVPTPRTRPEELATAPVIAGNLLGAVRLILAGRVPAHRRVSAAASDASTASCETAFGEREIGPGWTGAAGRGPGPAWHAPDHQLEAAGA